YVWAWGYNAYEQAGVSSLVQIMLPNLVMTFSGEPLSDVIQVAGGAYASFALRRDGTVWSWGSGTALGTGSYWNNAFLTQQVPLNDVSSITAGEDHVLALRNDGTVWSWGENYNGEGGVGANGDSILRLPT